LKQLTIRGLGTELHIALKQGAKRRGMSVNRYVLSILREAAGMGADPSLRDIEFHDLDHLAGTWTQSDLDEFEDQLALQRSIDEELWR